MGSGLGQTMCGIEEWLIISRRGMKEWLLTGHLDPRGSDSPSGMETVRVLTRVSRREGRQH